MNCNNPWESVPLSVTFERHWRARVTFLLPSSHTVTTFTRERAAATWSTKNGHPMCRPSTMVSVVNEVLIPHCGNTALQVRVLHSIPSKSIGKNKVLCAVIFPFNVFTLLSAVSGIILLLQIVYGCFNQLLLLCFCLFNLQRCVLFCWNIAFVAPPSCDNHVSLRSQLFTSPVFSFVTIIFSSWFKRLFKVVYLSYLAFQPIKEPLEML